MVNRLQGPESLPEQNEGQNAPRPGVVYGLEEIRGRLRECIPTAKDGGEGCADARREACAPHRSPDARDSNPSPTQGHRAEHPPVAAGTVEPPGSGYTLRPQEVAKGLVSSGALYGAGAAAVSAGTVLATGGLSSWPVAVAAAGSSALPAVVTGASLYGAGLLHNMLWNTGQKRPGVVGTMLRGVVAPLTIPVGLLRIVMKKA